MHQLCKTGAGEDAVGVAAEHLALGLAALYQQEVRSQSRFLHDNIILDTLVTLVETAIAIV
jgi:hypothetical protein